MKIIRAFPKKTSYTPIDDYVFIGMPPMRAFIPEHDEVHIYHALSHGTRNTAKNWPTSGKQPPINRSNWAVLPLAARRRISRRGYI